MMKNTLRKDLSYKLFAYIKDVTHRRVLASVYSQVILYATYRRSKYWDIDIKQIRKEIKLNQKTLNDAIPGFVNMTNELLLNIGKYKQSHKGIMMNITDLHLLKCLEDYKLLAVKMSLPSSPSSDRPSLDPIVDLAVDFRIKDHILREATKDMLTHTKLSRTDFEKMLTSLYISPNLEYRYDLYNKGWRRYDGTFIPNTTDTIKGTHSNPIKPDWHLKRYDKLAEGFEPIKGILVNRRSPWGARYFMHFLRLRGDSFHAKGAIKWLKLRKENLISFLECKPENIGLLDGYLSSEVKRVLLYMRINIFEYNIGVYLQDNVLYYNNQKRGEVTATVKSRLMFLTAKASHLDRYDVIACVVPTGTTALLQRKAKYIINHFYHKRSENKNLTQELKI